MGKLVFGKKQRQHLIENIHTEIRLAAYLFMRPLSGEIDEHLRTAVSPNRQIRCAVADHGRTAGQTPVIFQLLHNVPFAHAEKQRILLIKAGDPALVIIEQLIGEHMVVLHLQRPGDRPNPFIRSGAKDKKTFARRAQHGKGLTDFVTQGGEKLSGAGLHILAIQRSQGESFLHGLGHGRFTDIRQIRDLVQFAGALQPRFLIQPQQRLLHNQLHSLCAQDDRIKIENNVIDHGSIVPYLSSISRMVWRRPGASSRQR